MGSTLSPILGGANGLLGGLVANQREGGTNANNVMLNNDGLPAQLQGLQAQQQNSINGMQSYNGNATADVQNNSILGGTFGAGGTLDQTTAQEQQQASQPWKLTDQDQTAYGQASGNIANQFGQSDNSLSQSLSDRGLSNSGVAGAAFTGLQGNKNEQLGGLQTQIANSRMQMNQQRLAQTQHFLGQLTGQANEDINSAQNRGIGVVNSNNQMQQGKYNMAGGLLSGYQDQLNTALSQQQQTAHGSTLSNALGGMAAGTSAGYAAGMGEESGKSGGKKAKANYAGADAGSGSSMSDDSSSIFA